MPSGQHFETLLFTLLQQNNSGRKNKRVIWLFQFSSVQSLSLVWLFATPWIAAGQASLWLFEWVSEVAQLCLTLCDPMDCSLPGSPSTGFSKFLSFLVCIKSIFLSFFVFFLIKLAWRISTSMFLLLRNKQDSLYSWRGWGHSTPVCEEGGLWNLQDAFLAPGTMIYLLHTWLHCTAFSQQFLFLPLVVHLRKNRLLKNADSNLMRKSTYISLLKEWMIQKTFCRLKVLRSFRAKPKNILLK